MLQLLTVFKGTCWIFFPQPGLVAPFGQAGAARLHRTSENPNPLMHPPFSMLTKNAYFFTRPKLCLTVPYLKSRPAVCPRPCPLLSPFSCSKKETSAIIAHYLLSLPLSSTASPGLANINLLPSLCYTSPSYYTHYVQCSPTLHI